MSANTESTEITAPATPNAPATPVDVGEDRRLAARTFGIRMSLFGIVACCLPLFGLQVKQLGPVGSVAVGSILLVIGVGALLASTSKTSANISTLIAKGIMWIVIGLMSLIVLAVILGAAYVALMIAMGK